MERREYNTENTNTTEHQQLPDVWRVLERNVRLSAPDIKDRPISGSQEFWSEARELDRLERVMEEKGTPRDKLILDLFNNVTLASPYIWPGYKNFSLGEFQQFRSRVEPLSEEQIGEEIGRVKDEWSRKYDPYYKSGEGL
jgi:hypothetical protein